MKTVQLNQFGKLEVVGEAPSGLQLVDPVIGQHFRINGVDCWYQVMFFGQREKPKERLEYVLSLTPPADYVKHVELKPPPAPQASLFDDLIDQKKPDKYAGFVKKPSAVLSAIRRQT